MNYYCLIILTLIGSNSIQQFCLRDVTFKNPSFLGAKKSIMHLGQRFIDIIEATDSASMLDRINCQNVKLSIPPSRIYRITLMLYSLSMKWGLARLIAVQWCSCHRLSTGCKENSSVFLKLQPHVDFYPKQIKRYMQSAHKRQLRWSRKFTDWYQQLLVV